MVIRRVDRYVNRVEEQGGELTGEMLAVVDSHMFMLYSQPHGTFKAPTIHFRHETPIRRLEYAKCSTVEGNNRYLVDHCTRYCKNKGKEDGRAQVAPRAW